MKGCQDSRFDDSPRLRRLPVRLARASISVAAIIGLVIILASSAIPVWGAGRPPRSTPAALAAQPSPTATPIPQPVVADCAPLPAVVPADWAVVVCDPFDDNRGSWYTSVKEGDALGITSRAVADGGYTWDIDATQGFFVSSNASPGPVTDFYAAVDTHRTAGPLGDTQYGLEFRWQNNNSFYMFLTSDSRDYKIYLYNNGQRTILKDWTPTDAFLANDWNRMAVKAVGSTFTLYVNDQEIAQFEDSSLGQGSVRLVTQVIPGTESHATVDFDNFQLCAPGAGLAMGPTPAEPVRIEAGPATPEPASATDTPPPPTEPVPTDTPLPPTEPPPPPTATPIPKPVLPTPTEPPAEEALPPTPEGGWVGGIPTVVASEVTRWPIVFYDMFDDEANGWVTGEDFDRLIEASKVIDETFAWQFKGIQGVHTIEEVPWDAVSDFYAAVDGKRYSGPEDIEYGLTFRRADPDNFYSFLISDDLTYKIQVLAKDKWYPLTGEKKSKAIKPGESNRLAIKCEGPKLTFFVNGKKIDEVEDIRFRKGTIALTLNINQGDEGIMEFDNFELRVPPAEQEE